jgi:hypothetical protein
VDGSQSRGYNVTEAEELNASPYQQNRFRKNKNVPSSWGALNQFNQMSQLRLSGKAKVPIGWSERSKCRNKVQRSADDQIRRE